MRDVVVFVGPTIGLAEAQGVARFDYRPPAAQGDVYAAVRGGARVIGLIDGLFEGVPAVWHKEILFALSSGVHVFGAASMGALRAAELHIYGMRGVGRIFDWYASGEIDADDEVALQHGPADMDYLPLSVPLVNVRATLDGAVQDGVLGATGAQALLSAAQAIHFKDRTWKGVIGAAAREPEERHAFSEWLAAHAIDQKQADARAMIAAMDALVGQWPGRHKANFVFEPTDAWNAAVETFERRGDLSAFDMLVVDEARLRADFGAVYDAAASAVLAASVGAGFVALDGHGSRIDAFRKDRGLQARASFEKWLDDNALDSRTLDRHLGARASVRSIADQFHPEMLAAILAEIKLRGLYPGLAARAGRERIASAQGAHRVPRHLLLDWFFEQKLGRRPPEDLDDARRQLALPDVAALHELIAREYLLSGPEGKD